jgi:hypothetical protein
MGEGRTIPTYIMVWEAASLVCSRHRAGLPSLVRGMPLPDAALDISQHAPRSVREDAVVVIDVPNTNDAENDQKSQKHSHVYPRSVV